MKKFTQASLVADALCLGSHWIYNQGKIGRIYPNGVNDLRDPASAYHPGKKAGDFTHYGDQTLLLASLLDQQGSYDHEQWKSAWLAGMLDFKGYIDGASKETIQNNGLQSSTSNDLAGASRIGPVLDLNLELEEAVAAALSQTELTHGDPSVVDAAEFFTRTVYSILGGLSISEAVEESAKFEYESLDVRADLLTAKEADKDDYLAVSQKMGLTCHVPEAFPLTLYFALHHSESFEVCMSKNALAGGDNSARGMLLALLFAARDGGVPSFGVFESKETPSTPDVALGAGSHNVSIKGSQGMLAGVLEMPEGDPVAYAMFVHCFTCGKDFAPGTRVSRALAKRGIAVLRMDFSGIGNSEGEFAASSFLTNLDDLVTSAKWLEVHHQSPKLLIGHSLGGAAALAAAGQIESVKAVATIGAPADPAHVTHLFEAHLDEIKENGQAEVQLAGRTFTIGNKFLEDLCVHDHDAQLTSLTGIEKLIMHSTEDNVVPLENAGRIYSTLTHPKSFVALPRADHLLSKLDDAQYVADLIDVWARRILC